MTAQLPKVTTVVLKCKCAHPDHTGYVELHDDGDLFFFSQLTPLPFWGRVRAGLSYIFAAPRIYPHWDCMDLTRDSQAELKDLLEKSLS